MSQMKGQDKTQKQLKEVEIDNFPPKEFRIMIVKMIQNLGNNGEDARNVYQRPRRTKEKIEQTNNTLEGISSRTTEAEE